MTYEEIVAFYRDRLGVAKSDTVRLLADNTRFVRRKKGDHLLVAGEDMTKVIFHLTGAARCFVYDDQGRECVIGFCRDRGGACLGAAGIQEKVAFHVDAMSDMDILELPIDVLKYAMQKDAQTVEILHKLMIADHDVDYRWQIALQTKKGEDRYRWFLEEYADIVPYVAQKDIASFLCLHPQSLSRIKNQLDY